MKRPEVSLTQRKGQRLYRKRPKTCCSRPATNCSCSKVKGHSEGELEEVKLCLMPLSEQTFRASFKTRDGFRLMALVL